MTQTKYRTMYIKNEFRCKYCGVKCCDTASLEQHAFFCEAKKSEMNRRVGVKS